MTVDRRPIFPFDIKSSLALAATDLVDIRSDGKPVEFNLAIAADPSETDGQVGIQELSKKPNRETEKSFKDRMARTPHRYVNSVSFETFGANPGKDCGLQLELNFSLRSAIAPCPLLGELKHVDFRFENLLYPGVYSVRLLNKNDAADDRIAVAAAHAPSGGKWLLAWSGKKQTNAFSGFVQFVNVDPINAAIYALLVALVALLALKGPPTGWPAWACIVFALYGSNATITRHFSGHDETAHAEMLFSSLLNASEPPSSHAREGLRARFYESARKLMFDQDFYRLHAVQVPPKGSCPHMILGSCGISGSPQNLYDLYAKILPANVLYSGNARSIGIAGRAINLLWTLLLIILVAWLFGSGAIAPTLVILTSGAFLAQVSSITNDYPMMMLGIFGTGCLAEIISGNEKKATLGLLVFSIVLCASRSVDRSWVAGLLTLSAGTMILTARLLLRDAPSNIGQAPELPLNSRRGQVLGKIHQGFFALAVGVFVALSIIWAIPHLWAAGIQEIFKPILRLSPDGHMLLRAKPYSIQMTWEVLKLHCKSFVGSFVWGHSYFSAPVYSTFLAGWLYLALKGLRHVMNFKPRYRITVLVAIGLALGTYHALLMLLVSYNEMIPGSDLAAAVKFRFMAPGVASVVVLPFLGIRSLQSNPHHARTMIFVAIYWTMIFLTYYQLKFFYCDTL